MAQKFTDYELMLLDRQYDAARDLRVIDNHIQRQKEKMNWQERLERIAADEKGLAIECFRSVDYSNLTPSKPLLASEWRGSINKAIEELMPSL